MIIRLPHVDYSIFLTNDVVFSAPNWKFQYDHNADWTFMHSHIKTEEHLRDLVLYHDSSEEQCKHEFVYPVRILKKKEKEKLACKYLYFDTVSIREMAKLAKQILLKHFSRFDFLFLKSCLYQSFQRWKKNSSRIRYRHETNRFNVKIFRPELSPFVTVSDEARYRRGYALLFTFFMHRGRSVLELELG